jgi:hypothetical protein
VTTLPAILVSSDTALPGLLAELETALPQAIADRATAGGSVLDDPTAYLLDDFPDWESETLPICVVSPLPEETSRTEWATPQRDEGLAAAVTVIFEAATSQEATATALAYQRVIDVALTRIAHSRSIQGVWDIGVEQPINEVVGESTARRRAGYDARLWVRVTREEE